MHEKIRKLRSGVADVHTLLDEVLAEVESKEDELRANKEELETERNLFKEEAERVLHVIEESEQVTLNIGGHTFTTTVTTLRNAPAPSLFTAMFSGRHKLKKDANGCFFIDRDGRHFHEILNFLRDGKLNYPADGTDFKYLLELRAEAEFYGLTGLVQQIDRYPFGIVTVKRVLAFNVDDTWVYDDGYDEIIFTVDKSSQLLGVGLCGTLGGFTVQLQLIEVEMSADGYVPISTLQEAAQSYTKADGEIIKLLFAAPAQMVPGKTYLVRAHIEGQESYLCDECLETVIAGGVKFEFISWESPNGTTEGRGQFPELYIRTM
jgi:hypothetical protein